MKAHRGEVAALAADLASPENAQHYRRVFHELGGPTPLAEHPQISVGNGKALPVEPIAWKLFDSPLLRRLCAAHPFSEFQQRFFTDKDEDDQLRAWPWVVYGGHTYKSTSQDFDRSKDLQPAEADKLLSRLAASLEAAASDLARLSEAADMVRPLAPEEEVKGMAFGYTVRAIEDAFRGGGEIGAAGFAEDALRRMAEVAETHRLFTREPCALRTSGERLVGLRELVMMSGLLWEALLGKAPSAAKVEKKSGPSDPPFVVFVRSVAFLFAARQPSRKQVEVALNHIESRAGWRVEQIGDPPE